ncbi:hypothetical protein EZV62_008742 [Acer yangbiense]|uniref:phosphatidate cytidylyltransferase n=1 Tax=Acer yangbiense TaxID=1000413 RepID=A0A5C7IDT4_9ROSI|nr:hypothetical protein EZV62_008742 [Acer yangbiense]
MGGIVAPGCCSGLKALYDAIKTDEDVRTACYCIKDGAAKIPGLNDDRVNELPGICGTSNPVKLCPTLDCSNCVDASGHLYIWAMVAVIQIYMAKELFYLLRRAPEGRFLPGSRLLNWHFYFTAVLFVYGRILSQQLVNTVISDKFLHKILSAFIKYQMVICYFLYIASHKLYENVGNASKSGRKSEDSIQQCNWILCAILAINNGAYKSKKD